jgi:hypothetical protein
MRPLLSALLLAALLPINSLPAIGNPPSPIASLPTPAAADSQCSSLTRAPDGTLHLTYYGPAPADAAANSRTLWHATLAPNATTFSAPRAIVTTPLLMENWADFATLVVGTDGALTAQWFQKPTPDAGGYDGWFSRSADGGRTWRTPARLGHEFVALAPLSQGRTLAVWLESTQVSDPKATNPKPTHNVKHDHSTPRDPNTPYAPSMKLLARLLAPDGATLQEWTVDPDVCTCCQNTVAVLPGDRVFVAYRGHTRDEIRDNFYSTFDLASGSWSKPTTLKDDLWKIPACPVNGPAADGRDTSVAVAWFTAAEGVARVHARTSADAGETFTPPVPIDLGRPIGRLETVMLPDHSAIILWLEMKSDTNAAGLYARRLFPDGNLSRPQLLAETTQSRASGFPRAALQSNGHVLVSYTQNAERNQVQIFSFDPNPLTRSLNLTAAPRRATGKPTVLELCEAPLASLP